MISNLIIIDLKQVEANQSRSDRSKERSLRKIYGKLSG